MISYYKEHCENLRMLKKAIVTIQRTLKESIRNEDEEKIIYVYTKILSQLINSWAEVRILKLIYEKSAFTDREKETLLSTKVLKNKWQKALTIAFCKKYDVKEDDINSISTPITPRTRYQMLLQLISNDLLASTQVRNKIAHGQWLYGFNEDLKKMNPKITAELRKENIVQLQLKYNMFQNLAQIINDLAMSKPTFERDFDKNYFKLEVHKTNFYNINYKQYKKDLVSKRKSYLNSKKTSSP